MTSSNRPLVAWTGDFGDGYIERNLPEESRIAQREAMWRTILSHIKTDPPASILEVGSNIGLNLRALHRVTNARPFALEPNGKAREALKATDVVAAADILAGSADDIALQDDAVDLAFTCGVLIHVDPSKLDESYREMHRVSSKYLLSVEYFAAEPEEKAYRGQTGLLFKQDFGAKWLELFPDLKLEGYGFFWRPVTGLDNLTWWLFRKP